MRKNKLIVSKQEYLDRLKTGVDAIGDAVSATMGPSGRTVILENEYIGPRVTKDGVSVAREIFLEDSVANSSVQLLKEAAIKTNEVSGDGTSTCTLLGQAMFSNAHMAVSAGANPVAVKHGMEQALKDAKEAITALVVPVTKDDLRKIAVISANDETIGDLVAQAVDGDTTRVVSVEEASGKETSIEKVEGMKIPNGFISPYMVNREDKFESVLDKPFVALFGRELRGQEEIIPVFQIAASAGRPLVIIAEKIEGTALSFMILNQGRIPSVGIKFSAFGSHKLEVLEDLAIVTGGKIFAEGLADYKDPKITDLGTAERVVTKSDSTIISGGTGTKEAVTKRMTEIKAQQDLADNKFDKERLKERMSRLAGGVTVIKVGGATESEIKEATDRVEDAVQAVQAAIEGGILPGGGTTLAYVSTKIGTSLDKSKPDDYQAGYLSVAIALTAPVYKIMENAGQTPAETKASLEVSSVKFGHGYRVGTTEEVDMVAENVIDPAKVTLTALYNAGSIATLLIGSSHGVYHVQKKEKESQE